MIVDREQINKAQAKLGERTADIIADLLHLERYDSKNHKALCPFHEEDTPSFIYNTKDGYFHCFGCNKTVNILNAYMSTGMTYLESVEKLSEESGVPISLGEKGVRTKYQYRYPKEEQSEIKDQVYAYLGKRGISSETVDKLDVRQDSQGNCVFNYYDTNDVLTMVKYRPSHKIDKEAHENKCWCQKDADTTPLLFNMNRVTPDLPLLITEGEMDTLAAVEAGYSNAVSVPLGCKNFRWVEENFDWLEQFESIIICSDNDAPGMEMQKECVFRLGSWRTKFIDIPRTIEGKDEKIHNVKDLNEVLFFAGKQAVITLIQSAKDSPVPSVEDLSDVQDIDLNDIDGIYTGIQGIDSQLMKLFYGTLTVLSGRPGCVDCDTEFFNGKRWKKISKYKKSDKVLQFNPDGSTSLVYPERYIKEPCDEMYWFKTGGIDQLLSKEHNIVYMDGDCFKKISVEKYLNMKNRPELKIPSGILGLSPDFITYDVNGNKLFSCNCYSGKLTPEKVKPKDGYKYCFTVSSGMFVTRRNSVINATGNSGKSSFISQLICQTMEQGKSAWMFSREMPGWMCKSWLNYILASGHNIKEYADENGTPYYKVSPIVKDKISEYYRGQWFIYKDDASNKLDDLIVSMTDSVRKYGTRLLILDNLMMIDLGTNESNELLKQTEAINKLITFAMKYDVAVVLVAHPRKLQADADVGLYDISGSSNIINLAHRTIGISRIKNKAENNHDVRMTIIKDRMRGRAGEFIDLYYDVASRRFYENEREYNYQYSWDKEEHLPLPYPHAEEYEVIGEATDE